MSSRFITLTLVLLAVGALSACDVIDSIRRDRILDRIGPEPRSRPALSATDAQRRTGSEQPDPNDSYRQQRAEAARANIDTLIPTRVRVRIGGQIRNPERLDCTGLQCTITDNTGRLRFRFTRSFTADDIFRAETYTDILTKEGITLWEGRGDPDSPNYRAYGAWMDHAAFGVHTALFAGTASVTVDEDTISGLKPRLTTALVVGDTTGTRPAANATFRGVMVGVSVSSVRNNAFRDSFLQGDAELSYGAQRGRLRATFTNIQNLDEPEHDVEDITFTDVPVSGQGTYGKSMDGGNYIRGSFFGPNQAEAAGAFENQRIFGAFGAKRANRGEE